MQEIYLNQITQASLTTVTAGSIDGIPTSGDEYALIGLEDYEQVRVNLDSSGFDGLLELVDTTTGETVAKQDNPDGGSKSVLTFTALPSTNYLIRVTGKDLNSAGNYVLNTNSDGIIPATGSTTQVSTAPDNTTIIKNNEILQNVTSTASSNGSETTSTTVSTQSGNSPTSVSSSNPSVVANLSETNIPSISGNIPSGEVEIASSFTTTDPTDPNPIALSPTTATVKPTFALSSSLNSSSLPVPPISLNLSTVAPAAIPAILPEIPITAPPSIITAPVAISAILPEIPVIAPPLISTPPAAISAILPEIPVIAPPLISTTPVAISAILPEIPVIAPPSISTAPAAIPVILPEIPVIAPPSISTKPETVTFTGNPVPLNSAPIVAGITTNAHPTPMTVSTNNLLNIIASGAKIQFTPGASSAAFHNEMGVFVVDDEQGRVNGILPGAAGYLAAAMSKSQIVGGKYCQLDFQAGTQLGFYLVQDGTSADIKADLAAGKTPKHPVFFQAGNTDNSDHLKVTQSGNNYTFAWEDMTGGGDRDFNDSIFNATLSVNPTPKGDSLQGSQPVVDLRDISGLKAASMTVGGSSSYDNFIGFYRVDDASGKIGTLNPSDLGYAQAAIGRSVSNYNKNVGNAITTVSEGILAPYLIANGTVESFLANNPTNQGDRNLPNAYFGYIGANPDKIEHMRLLGDNKFGFEDIFGGGDRDFNDAIVQLHVAT